MGIRHFRIALPWLIATVLVSLVLAPSPSALRASSHRDAPLITEDPVADNTDVYAFVSTESGRQNFVTLISNWIPFEEPTEGPNYYRFSDDVLYEIAVVARASDDLTKLTPALTYQFRFHTTVANGNTFLYNTGLIGAPPNPSDPTSQYTNLNVQQSYTLTEVRADGTRTVLLRGARVAPVNIGPNSTGPCGSPPDATNCSHYIELANTAVHAIPGTGGMRVFAGPRADMFYVDLMGAFDLLGGFTNEVRNPGVNSTAGFNVHSIALEVPMSRLDSVAPDKIIGVWSSSSRLRIPVLSEGQEPSDQDESSFVQVSRLGNPLVNEVLIPLRAKDRFNRTTPLADESTFADFIVNPGSSQGPLALIPLIHGVLGCTAVNGRADLQAALLTGIPMGVVGGFPGNFTGVTRADLLRLNYTVEPAHVDPNNPGSHRLGLLAGDIAGFPNGRRPFDDVVDIELKAAGGVLQPLVGLPQCDSAGGLTDNVNGPGSANPFLTTPASPGGVFPYLGIPHQGFDETK